MAVWLPSKISERYSPRVGASGLGVYPLNTSQIRDFYEDLWSVTFFEKIIEWAFGNPLDSIIGVRWYYGINNAIPRTTKEAYITVGNESFQGLLGFEKEIKTRPARSEYVHVNCGHIILPKELGDYRDLEPFTKLEIYIPFVGSVQLKASDFISRNKAAYGDMYVYLSYNINLITGAAVAVVRRPSGGDHSKLDVVYTAQCQMGVDIPMNVNAKEEIYSRMATGLAGIAMTAGIAVAAPAMASSAVGAAAGARSVAVAEVGMAGLENGINAMQGGDPGGTRGGGLDGEMSSLTSFRPYVRITRKIFAAPPNYQDTIGRPDYSIINVGQAKGYIKAAALTSASHPLIPQEAMQEITQLLKGGLYVS